tara:strand:+ start:188 stop:535 length:348 start_codon:yes stop_codon:yes gene_type:complete
MPTFPNINPSFGLQKRSKPNTIKVKLGDGYEQRLIFGLPAKQNPKIFSLKWENITETEADTIETFLDARNGVENFDYQPPGESSTSKFVCEEWDKQINFADRATIKAVFREVFEP